MNWKEEFLEKMFVEKDIENGLLLRFQHQPETIFRYTCGNENDKNALLNNQIWLSNMKCVNDKFEGKLEILYANVNFHFLADTLKAEVENIMEEIISSFYIACKWR